MESSGSTRWIRRAASSSRAPANPRRHDAAIDREFDPTTDSSAIKHSPFNGSMRSSTTRPLAPHPLSRSRSGKNLVVTSEQPVCAAGADNCASTGADGSSSCSSVDSSKHLRIQGSWHLENAVRRTQNLDSHQPFTCWWQSSRGTSMGVSLHTLIRFCRTALRIAVQTRHRWARADRKRSPTA